MRAAGAVLMTRCRSCGAPLAPFEHAEGPAYCDECEDDCAADEHGESCDCGACDRVRSRYARQAREREAATCGGISDFGREVLGW